MRVTVLACGSMLIDYSQLFWNHHPGRSVRHPVFAVLIEHPAGHILVDTGFDLAHVQSDLPFVEARPDLGGPLEAALSRAGVNPGDVNFLIHTHLHFDHVGGDRLVPDATVFVHRQELRQARVPESFERLSYSDQRFCGPDTAVELIDVDSEVLPGVWMLETPGHSAGHCSVLLKGNAGGSLLLCGDATYTRANLEQAVISGFHIDPVQSVRSIHRLRELAADGDPTLWFPHDMDEFETYPSSPAWLDLG
jgi:4-pyridoxolactonase